MMGEIMKLCEYKLEWVYDDDTKKASQQMVPRDQPVPIVFAFTRKALSRQLKRPSKTSCVAVLSHDGASELFYSMLKQADGARKEWAELTAPYPEGRDAPRKLIMRHAKKQNRSRLADELTMHAREAVVSWDPFCMETALDALVTPAPAAHHDVRHVEQARRAEWPNWGRF